MTSQIYSESKGFVFLTGMFRSGTTLLARMLNAHSQIACASDPYARLFKAFRNEVALRAFGEDGFDANAPLDDYYFYPSKQQLMNEIQARALDMDLRHVDLQDLRKKVADASRPFSPKIEPLLGRLQGDTFADLFASGLDVINEAYGDSETRLLGFKEVWVGEFGGHLLRQFPDAKVIHIIRDPRAVCASKNVTSEKYPWLFLCRQWRKLATFAWLDQETFGTERVMVVRYEDLISSPQETSQSMCDFLEIDFDEKLVEPSGFKGGDGQAWVQNSSYADVRQDFNTFAIDRWREALTSEQIAFVEGLCSPEMRVMGYAPEILESPGLPSWKALRPSYVEVDELAGWIQPYSPSTMDELMQEMALEYIRSDAISRDINLTDEDKQALCLNAHFFDIAQEACQPALSHR